MTTVLDEAKDEALASETLEQARIVNAASRIKHVLQPRGRKNRKVMFLLVVAGAMAAAMLWVAIAGAGQTHSAGGRRADHADESGLENPPVETPLVSGPAQYAALAPPPADKVVPEAPKANPANDTSGTGRFPISAGGPAPFPGSPDRGATSPGPVESAQAPKSVFAGNVQDDFALKLRAASVARESHQHSPDASGSGKELKDREGVQAAALPKGLRIPMQLLDPVATGAESNARVRVTDDVLDKAGALLIPRGTEGYLPFARGEIVGGRVTLNTREKGALSVNGQELALTGSIRGQDGRVGIPGEVKKSGGGNVVRKSLGIVGRTASSIVGRTTGIPTYDAEAVISPGNDIGSQYGMSREVLVKKETKFTFVVGQ